MAAMGRKENDNKALRDQIAQLTAQDPQGALAAEPAMPQWEPGTRLEVSEDGQVVEYEPPQPQSPGEQNHLGRGADPTKPKRDDGSAEWAKNEMFRQLGTSPDKSWLG